MAERVPGGPTISAMSEAARRNNVWLVAGTIAELYEDDIYNTCPVFDRSGHLVTTFRKAI